MLVTAVSPAGLPLAIVRRVVWDVLHWNPYNFEKVTTVPSLSLSLTTPPIVLVCWLPMCPPSVRPSTLLEGLCRRSCHCSAVTSEDHGIEASQKGNTTGHSAGGGLPVCRRLDTTTCERGHHHDT